MFEEMLQRIDHPSFRAALADPPQSDDAEIGAVVREQVLRALMVYEALPKHLTEGLEGGPATILGMLIGGWTAGLTRRHLLPLVRWSECELVVAGAHSIRTALLEEKLDKVPILHRSALATIISAVAVVLENAPSATKPQQADAVVALLRQHDDWLPPSLDRLN